MAPSLPRVDSSAMLASRPSNLPLLPRTPERQAAWWFCEWLVQQKLMEVWALEIQAADIGPDTVLTARDAAAHTSWLDPHIAAAEARVEELRKRKTTTDAYYPAGAFTIIRKLDKTVQGFIKATVEKSMPAITFERAVEYHNELRDLIDQLDPTLKFPDEDSWFETAA